ncbi:MAG: IclR family transcriptional regulator [Deltaproteobacteria bacterium]|nr:IclR family transcriptional regulator [Deltaproteobacteria bacterium]
MKSLHKVLDIVDYIALSGKAGIREISDHTGFPPPTAHRIVSTLVGRHYLEQDPATKGYALSLKFLELGSLVQHRFDLVRIAKPHLELIVAETKESASLIVRDGDEAVYLDHVQDQHMLQLFTRVGARVPLYSTGGGKVLLGGMTDAEIGSYLKRSNRTRHTDRTLVEAEALKTELAAVRRLGYAVDDEEMEEGIRCVAVPVYKHDGTVAAALSLSGAAIRIRRERMEELARIVLYRALSVSRALGFKPGK